MWIIQIRTVSLIAYESGNCQESNSLFTNHIQTLT